MGDFTFLSLAGVIMSLEIRNILNGFAQFVFLAFLVTLPIITLSIDFIYLKQGLSENSMTEYLQEILLLLTTLSFAYTAYKDPSTRHFCVLLTGFFACMFIRELDGLFDLIFHGFWVIPATLVALFSIIFALRNKQQALSTFSCFVQSRHFITLNLGMALLLVFSRLFGIGELWEGILGSNYDRIVKRVAEEGLEVLGYTIIFYSAMGYLFSFLAWSKQAEGDNYSDFIEQKNLSLNQRSSR